MKIQIWSDVVCPYCYIGKREFENALAQFPHRDRVEVEWKSFELDREAPVLSPDDCTACWPRSTGARANRPRKWWPA